MLMYEPANCGSSGNADSSCSSGNADSSCSSGNADSSCSSGNAGSSGNLWQCYCW